MCPAPARLHLRRRRDAIRRHLVQPSTSSAPATRTAAGTRSVDRGHPKPVVRGNTRAAAAARRKPRLGREIADGGRCVAASLERRLGCRDGTGGRRWRPAAWMGREDLGAGRQADSAAQVGAAPRATTSGRRETEGRVIMVGIWGCGRGFGIGAVLAVATRGSISIRKIWWGNEGVGLG